MEYIVEFIVLFLFSYPGAFVLSIFSRNKTYKDYLTEDGYFVGIIGLLVVAVFIKLIIIAYNYTNGFFPNHN